jgi:hypothetical protein
LETLAAACAESGDFDSAVKWEQKAIDLSQDDGAFVKRAKERLALYREKKPYRQADEASNGGDGMQPDQSCS